jgi:catechol 2,3-dioxygenase-like lactoylglutathione lyase family enzyme
MARGIDHIVHTVRDLDAAGELYARLGFTVGARNRHPWGTDNCIVQFPGCFIELLTVAQPEKIAPRGPRLFSFGVFNRDFLERREGLSMIALESRDAEADARAFREAGIGDFDVFHFEREGRKPDGTPVKVAFSLAYAQDEKSPEAAFFVCQQHFPENFWNPAFQTHANTASAIAALVLVADNPTDHHIFLSAFAGEREIEATSTGIRVKTPRGELQAMDPESFRIQLGVEPPDVTQGARMAALRIGVRDIAAAQAALKAAGVPSQERMGRIVVPPTEAMGATVVFEPAAG